ncbi:thiol reductant ABC exporter subunit CydD [Leptolinea tardivitalis]|uniref:Thiol reductant ABC exporter subunit CydD n=1 Tax=Leptolinea tardivitalis TaxID=229920 RepID=A0A0P6X0M3_9CHLR|nr:thiol reductant ABC exporter subunit CydD [Leptolinea tardivitalis]KPL72790.1 hypothetical protein ADM99_06905 [Leptolinea tardivitalis]GAP20851.1 thiol reductant ABC exporter, CydD subunit [Leptolinea tardivitalis]
MTIQRRLTRLAISNTLLFTIVIISAILTGGLVIGQAWFLSQIISRVHLEKADLEQVSPLLVFLITIVIFRAIAVFTNEYSASILSENIRADIREKLTAKVLKLGPAFISQQQAGSLSYTLTGAIDTLDAYFSQYLPQLVIAAVLPLGILAVVFPIDVLSAVILLLTAPLIPIFMILIGKTTETLTHRQYQTFSKMSGFFLDSIRGIAELKKLGRIQDHAVQLDIVSERYRSATMNVLRISFLSALVLELAATLSVAVIAVEIGIRLLYGQIEFQQAFFLLVIAPEFYLPLRQLGARFHASRNGVSAARQLFTILDEPEPRLPAAIRKTSSLFTLPFDIQFEDVSFVYPGRDNEAVSHVTFSIQSGETIALVGLNGAGKSTLVSLFLRFIEPQSGRILYNNQNIQEFSVDQWRTGIAWLDQRPTLFNASIRENLSLVQPEADEKELLEALRDARLDDLILNLPQGLDTQVGENAFRFSGGQAQRLGLARAFLKNAPILVLDEPTSHLDALLETDLTQSLSKLKHNRTCLIIAHRLDTVRQADRVIMLQAGKLVCSGKHDDLLQSNHQYAALFAGESKL